LLREKPATWDSEIKENENILCCREKIFAKKKSSNIPFTGFVWALCAQGEVAAEGPAELACNAG